MAAGQHFNAKGCCLYRVGMEQTKVCKKLNFHFLPVSNAFTLNIQIFQTIMKARMIRPVKERLEKGILIYLVTASTALLFLKKQRSEEVYKT
jgi:hypothetical protein